MNRQIDMLYKVSLTLMRENGLCIASTGEFYQHFCWMRDMFYQSLPHLLYNHELYKKMYRVQLDYLWKLESRDKKLSLMILYPDRKNIANNFIHARIDPINIDEINTEWGNRQNDAVASFLLGIVWGEKAGIKIIESLQDIHIVNLLIQYLGAVEFHKCKDNGIWEEMTELHSSSIGACIGALKALRDLNYPGILVPDKMITLGQRALNRLLPKETPGKEFDMAQLTLIYPFDVVSEKQKEIIIYNIETYLMGDYGCKRYLGDTYDGKNHLNKGDSEPEWALGDLYMAIIYSKTDPENAKIYLNKVLNNTENGNITEMFVNGKPCINTPLGWAVGLAIMAIHKIYFI